MKDSSSVGSNTDDSFVDVASSGNNNPCTNTDMSMMNNNNAKDFVIKIGIPNTTTTTTSDDDDGETKEDSIKYYRLRLGNLIPDEKNSASSSSYVLNQVCYKKLMKEFTARTTTGSSSTTTTTSFTYHDGDGDLCVVSCTQDLVEAIQQAIDDGSSLLKLHVPSLPNQESCPSTTANTCIGVTPLPPQRQLYKWQSEEVTIYRLSMVYHIVKLLKLKQNNRNLSAELLSELHQKAKQMEVALYRQAPSLHAYLDNETLEDRLHDAFPAFFSLDNKNEQRRDSSNQSTNANKDNASQTGVHRTLSNDDPSVAARILRAMEGPEDDLSEPLPQRPGDLEQAPPDLMMTHLLEGFHDHQNLEFSPAFFCDEKEDPMSGNDVWVHYRIQNKHYKSRFFAMDDIFLDLTNTSPPPPSDCDNGMGSVQLAIPSVFLGRIVDQILGNPFSPEMIEPPEMMGPFLTCSLADEIALFDTQQPPMVRFYKKKENLSKEDISQNNDSMEIMELEPRLPLTEVLQSPEYRHFYKVTGVFEARPVLGSDHDNGMPPPPPMGYPGFHECYDDHPPPPPQEMRLSLRLVELVLFEAHDHVLDDLDAK